MLNGQDKAFYQPWNEEEFQSDLYVRKMNCHEKWMYRTLLQAMFFHSTRPYLPADDEVLWMLADCDSPEQWIQHKDKVLARFYTENVQGQPMLAHGRVMKDWQRLVDKREALAERGRSGGLAKAKRQLTKKESKVSKASEVEEREVEQDPALALAAYADRMGN